MFPQNRHDKTEWRIVTDSTVTSVTIVFLLITSEFQNLLYFDFYAYFCLSSLWDSLSRAVRRVAIKPPSSNTYVKKTGDKFSHKQHITFATTEYASDLYALNTVWQRNILKKIFEVFNCKQLYSYAINYSTKDKL